VLKGTNILTMKIFKNRKSVTTLACVLFLSAVGLASCIKDNNHYVTTPSALLMVIQASPDAPAENLFLKPNQVNQSAFNYGNFLGYFNATPGNRVVQLFNYGSSTLIAADTQPATGKATIRFVNVSAGSANVDLLADSAKLITNEPYKGASVFTPVSGDLKYNFQVRATGSTTGLASLENVEIKNGGVYTIWYHGSTTGTNPKLSADIIANAYY